MHIKMKKVLDKKKPSGPVKIGRLKVWVDRSRCIGAATCIAVAPKAFDLDSEAKAVILDTSTKEAEDAIIEAAKACPVAAIIVEDEKGKRIFPK